MTSRALYHHQLVGNFVNVGALGGYQSTISCPLLMKAPGLRTHSVSTLSYSVDSLNNETAIKRAMLTGIFILDDPA